MRRFLAPLLLIAAPVPLQADEKAAAAGRLTREYVDAVRKVNEEHARRPGMASEADLAKRLPTRARDALSKLLDLKDSPGLRQGLLSCGEAALDLDLLDDFERVHARLERESPEDTRRLGVALSRPRFILRGTGGIGAAFLEELAGILEAVLVAYDEVFGFKEWSKVPGKKLRVKLLLEQGARAPPHFAPELPFHSEIYFPVADGSAFKSPTRYGKFLLYGLCHELGHAIAMWGDRSREEDHHAWAHYTGAAIVEHLSEKAKGNAALEGLSDVRWRSLSAERKRLAGSKPSLADRDGVLALLLELHDRVGARAIGEALNLLDARDRRLRVNRVRYYGFGELRGALLEVLKKPEERRAVEAILPEFPAR